MRIVSQMCEVKFSSAASVGQQRFFLHLGGGERGGAIVRLGESRGRGWISKVGWLIRAG